MLFSGQSKTSNTRVLKKLVELAAGRHSLIVHGHGHSSDKIQGGQKEKLF